MIRTLLLTSLMIMMLSSCTRPYVQTYFAVGCGSGPLPISHGAIVWADGQPVSSTGQVSGRSTSRLLTFILITPGAGSGSVSSFDSGGSVATFGFSKGYPPDKLEVSIKWDKRLDVVKIEGTEYDRSRGTLFVIVKSLGSRGEVWQLRSPTGTEKAEELLKLAQRKLPEVKALQAVLPDRK